MNKSSNGDHQDPFSALDLSPAGFQIALRLAPPPIAAYLWMAYVAGWTRDTFRTLYRLNPGTDWRLVHAPIAVPRRSGLATVGLVWSFPPDLANAITALVALLITNPKAVTDEVKRLNRLSAFRRAAPGESISHERARKLGLVLTPPDHLSCLASCLSHDIPGRYRARLAYQFLTIVDLTKKLMALVGDRRDRVWHAGAQSGDEFCSLAATPTITAIAGPEGSTHLGNGLPATDGLEIERIVLNHIQSLFAATQKRCDAVTAINQSAQLLALSLSYLYALRPIGAVGYRAKSQTPTRLPKTTLRYGDNWIRITEKGCTTTRILPRFLLSQLRMHEQLISGYGGKPPPKALRALGLPLRIVDSTKHGPRWQTPSLNSWPQEILSRQQQSGWSRNFLRKAVQASVEHAGISEIEASSWLRHYGNAYSPDEAMATGGLQTLSRPYHYLLNKLEAAWTLPDA